MRWWRKSADQNYAHAQCNLGQMYDHGCGVEKDEVEAVRWYRKSAAQNNASAQYNLGNKYRTGAPGIKQDLGEALKWRKRPKAEAKGEGMQTRWAIAPLPPSQTTLFSP